MDDRRKFMRLDVAMSAEMELVSLKNLLAPVKILDVSREGMRIFSERLDVASKKEIGVRVNLSSRDFPITAIAQVRWVHPREDGCEIGLEMNREAMSASDRDDLLQYAYRLWRGSGHRLPLSA